MKRTARFILSACITPCITACILVISITAYAGQKDSRLDALFAQLRVTSDEAVAQDIQETIWRLWTDAGEEQTDAVMARGMAEISTGDYPAALEHFNVVIEMAPYFAEGWNKRATVLYFMGDFEGSVRDIGRTLALEPRHWGALSGLGLIHMRSNNLRGAIKAFEGAIAINPHLAGTKIRLKQLKIMLKGRPT